MAAYLVLARASFDQPLTQQGTVEAADDEAAEQAALERFGRDWVELSLAPVDSVHWVLGA
jgi:1,2-phenylacetyl-CoA epoxidase PaaB subunit